jgi:hypothetical protein
MGGKVVDRHFNGPAGDQLAQVPGHQVGFQGIGMVEIDPGALSQRQVAGVLVVGVMLDHHHLRMVDALHDGVGNGRFPRCRAPGHADDQWLSLHGSMVA